MSKTILMDFQVDREAKQINVTREFDAPLDLVWQAWTKKEILDQWWAPKPWKAVTKSMDFREGGTWLYYMLGPEGEKHWCIAEYKAINPQRSFSWMDAFCDEKGVINKELPRTNWDNKFSEKEGTTTVSIKLTYKELADLEKIIEMGFKEGFTAGLKNLDEWLAKNPA